MAILIYTHNILCYGDILKIIHFYNFDSDSRFPPFLLYVGGNLGSFLNGDISVMAFKHSEIGIRGF